MFGDGRRTRVQDHAGTGFAYFLGFLGSAVYYIQSTHGFWAGVGGFLKACVWPAFVVYDLLKAT